MSALRWGLLGVLLVARSVVGAQGPAVALVGASVVDVERGALLADQTVIVRGDRIVGVGPRRTTRVPPGATVVNLNGRFLIPGLWDMHVHSAAGAWFQGLRSPAQREAAADYFRSLFLAAGVTGVREMGGDLAALGSADSAARRQHVPRPRVLPTGEKVGDATAVAGAPFPVRSAEDVRQSIAMLRTAGATHIKLGLTLPPNLVRAALATCKQETLRCSAHNSRALPASESSTLGLRSLEHLFLLSEETSSLPAAQLAAWRAEVERPTLIQRVMYKLRLRHRPPDVADTAVVTHDSTKAIPIFRGLATNGTWVTPTLTIADGLTRVGARDTAARRPGLLIEPLDSAFLVDRRSPQSRASATRREALEHRLVRELRDAGVGLLAGSDTPVNATPGMSLHGELVLLQRAGLSPLDALRAATLGPARYLAATDSLGTVSIGRVADVVVLRANPLADVTNTRAIEMVMTRGRLLRRAELDSLEAAGKRALESMRR